MVGTKNKVNILYRGKLNYFATMGKAGRLELDCFFFFISINLSIIILSHHPFWEVAGTKTFVETLEESCIIKRVSWFKSSLLLRIKTVDITNINS